MASTSLPPTTLDAQALRRFLDGPHREIRELVRDTLSSPELDRAGVADLDRDAYRDQVLEWAKALAAKGEAALGFPVEHGGRGDVGGSVAAFETMAHGDLSLLVKIGVQFGLWGGAVLHLGTESHHERLLSDIATLELPGCFAMTERGHGSDVQCLETTATYDADTGEFVVHTPHEDAGKDWIGNAARHGRMAAVFAQLVVDGSDHGVHALVVPLRDAKGKPLEGVRIEDCGPKLGLDGVDNGRIWFDHVRVPREALLNRFANVTPDGRYESPIENPDRRFFTMLGTLIQGRVCVGGAAISASKSALTMAIRYALSRRQFKAPGAGEVLLLDYRTHQRRLFPLLARSYALHAAQEEVVAQLHRAFTTDELGEVERRELETRAAGLKAIATWHATRTVQECREACGGAGYLRDNGFAALKADTDVFTTFEGDNTVLLQLVGKSLLTGYSADFGSLDLVGTVGFVVGQVIETVVERISVRQVVGAITDAVTIGDDEGDLLDREDQLSILRWREEHMLAGVARRLKRGIDDGDDAFTVFMSCQDHVIATARAHVEREVLEAFARQVERCEDPALAAHLGRMCDLFALTTIEDDRGWFLEHGRLSPARSKAATRTVNQLCGDVREHAGALVDAFGIPQDVLRSELAERRG